MVASQFQQRTKRSEACNAKTDPWSLHRELGASYAPHPRCAVSRNEALSFFFSTGRGQCECIAPTHFYALASLRSVSVYVPVYLLLCVHMCIYTCIKILCLCARIPCLSLPVNLSSDSLILNRPIYLSACLSVYLLIRLFVHLSIYRSTYLSVDLSICLCVYLQYYQTILVPIYRPTYLSICQPTYLLV